MRKVTLFLVITIILVCFSVGCNNVEALTINDIQGDPLSFTGEITITGVMVPFTNTDKTIFGVMDTAELLACKNINCGAFTLPARYVGTQPLPNAADELIITGSWAQYEDGHIFEVTKISVKRNIMNLISS